MRHRGILRDPLASPDGQHYQDEAEGGGLQHLAGTNASQIDAHEQGDGNRHRNGERAPGAGLQGVHHDQSNYSEQNHQDDDDGGIGDEAANASGLFLGHFGQRLAVATH